MSVESLVLNPDRSGRAAAAAIAPASVRAYRLTSIDMLRGLVLVIMVLDHVRDFFMINSVQDPMSDPNVGPALFATRWITHFCAPVFVLLAGTSAGLMTARKTPAELGAFLLKRGLWLIVIECLVVSTGFSFAPFGSAVIGGLIFLQLQVIWAIGASMVVLSAAQFLGARACLALGLVIVCGHNLLDPIWPVSTAPELGHPLWVALHAPMSVIVGPYRACFAYPLLPWIGVMLCGFGVASVFRLPAARRDALLLRSGLALTALFIVVRAFDVYGDANGWHVQENGAAATVMDFLNVTKYPPSLMYVLMTIGPAAILCAFAERFRGIAKDTLVTLGRVPFAYYVLHIYLIHGFAVLLGVMQGFEAGQFFVRAGWFPKQGYGLPLSGVYLVWILIVALLYPFCRWVAQVKARRNDWWLSYL